LTVIRDVTVVDGTGAPPLEHASVVVEDDTIREVGPAAAIRIDGRAGRVLNGDGAWVVPGLIDMHVHLCIAYHPDEPGGSSAEVTPQSLALATAYGVANARELLRRGVTTVRDVGCHGSSVFAVQRLVARGEALGPRIIPCGRAIAMTGGHGLYIGVQADGAEGVRHAARAEVAAGARALKFMASGSGAAAGESPQHVHLTLEELAAGIAVAKALGLKTCVHATNSAATKNALQAGADSIEHGIETDDEALEMMLERGSFLVPTLWAYRFVGEYGGHLGTPPEVVEQVRSRYEGHMDCVARARRLGVPIVAGTDSAMPVNPPESLVWELEWLVRCGLSELEAIQSATATAARLAGLDDRLGTIEPGKLADLVVVDGNPLADIGVLARPTHVVSGGRLVVEHGRLTWDDVIREWRPLSEDDSLPAARAAAGHAAGYSMKGER
jgi:imidazolonepropionase-like amidohydrolase